MLPTLLALSTLAAHAAPQVVVTFTDGDVALAEGRKQAPTPRVPFVLDAVSTLVVAEDARVRVLVGGQHQELTGPLRWRPDDEEEAAYGSADGTALGRLLTRPSQEVVAAVRGGSDLQLVRPLPGAPATSLTRVAWQCACGEVPVVLSLPRGEVLWETAGTRSLAYDGPALEGGLYRLTVGGEPFDLDIKGVDAVSPAGRALAEAETLAETLLAAGVAPAEAHAPWVLAALASGRANDALQRVDGLVAHDPSVAALELALTVAERVGLAPAEPVRKKRTRP